MTIIRSQGLITEVKCNNCGTTIQAMVPLEQGSSQRKVGDTVLRTERVVLAPNNMYAELALVCKDENGNLSKHITHVCRACQMGLTDTDTKKLQGFLDADHKDMEQFDKPDPENLKLWSSRTVIGVEK